MGDAVTAQLALFAGPAPDRERTGRERKAAALATLQGGNARWLEAVREHARWRAERYGDVTADDLDGSADMVVDSERGVDRIQRWPARWGPAAGYTDRQPGEGTT